MPFLLLDDATDEATRRLQDFGQQQLTNLTQAGQTAQSAVQGAVQTVQQAPQQVQGGLQDITARLQDFGQQQVQNAVQTIQPLQAAQRQVQQKQQDAQDALGRLQTFGSDQLTNLTQPPPPPQPKTTDQLGGGQPAVQPGGDLQSYARQAAQKAGIDPDIFTAQIQQESGFNPAAKSRAGAIGIAQFMPGTAQGMGVDPTDPYAALDAAARLDAQNLAKYGGDYSKALAAYNAGPGAVDQYGGVPPFQETQSYVKTILGGARQAVGGAVSGVKQAITGQPDTSGDVFPVVGYQGDIADHWGSVKGGSDIMAPRGTPVVAMRGGKVLESGWNDVGGNSVLIQGDDGNQYYYAHFDGAPSVKVGDSVPSGTPLGAVGNTGDAKGGPTHLHIGIGPTILLGADKYGGTGGDYDAVGLLRSTLQGDGQRAPDTAAGPASLAPPTPQAIASAAQGGLNQLGAAKDQAVQKLQDITSYASTPEGARDIGAHTPSAFISDRLRDIGPALGAPPGGYDLNDILDARKQLGAAISNSSPVPNDVVANAARLAVGGFLQQPSPLESMQTLQDLNAKYAASAPPGKGGFQAPVDPSVMTPEDRAAYTNAMLAVAGVSTLGVEAGDAAGTTRMFHGTSADFPSFDPARISGEGNLYGPGYYLTSDPRVAGGVIARGGEPDPLGPLMREGRPFERGEVIQSGYAQQNPAATSDTLDLGANVRAVDVPNNLDLFDMETPPTPAQARAIGHALWGPGGARPLAGGLNDPEVRQEVDGWSSAGADGASLYDLIRGEVGGSKAAANRVLADAGFDGISYSGGRRIPMSDATGAPIEHDANVIFPESLDKIRNAVSGRMGGEARPEYATLLGAGGAAAGALALGLTNPNSNRVMDTLQPALDQAGNFVSPVTSAIGGALDQAGRNVSGNLGTRPLDPDEQAQRDAMQARMDATGYKYEPIGLESLIPGGGGPSTIGPTSPGDVLEQQINQAIAQGNPLRDVPVAGPVSTWLGQQVLNPTNLTLMGEGALREPGVALESLLRDPAVARFVTDENGTLNIGRLLGGTEGALPHGMAIPETGYEPGTPEHTIETALRQAADDQGTNRPNLTNAQIQALPGLAGSKTTDLNEVREAIQTGLPAARWYSDVVQQIAQDTGQNINPREAAVLMGATGADAGVTANYHAMLTLFRAIRLANPDLTGLENMDSKAIQELPWFQKMMTDFVSPEKPYVKPDMVARILKGYRTGEIPIPSGAKLSSYTQNFLHALSDSYDPYTTQDVWQGRLFGARYMPNPDKPNATGTPLNPQAGLMQDTSTPDVAAKDQTYRAMHTLTNWIARELNINPREAQAAGWGVIRTLWNDPTIGRDLATGNMSLRDALAYGMKQGYFAPSQFDTLADVRGPMPQAGAWGTKLNDIRSRIRADANVYDTPPPPTANGLDTMQLVYPGQGAGVRLGRNGIGADVQRPITAELAQNLGSLARLGGPVLRVPGTVATDSARRIPGLDLEHSVQVAGDHNYVHLVGVGDDAANAIGQALGADAYTHYDPAAGTLGGIAITDLQPDEAQQLTRQLRMNGVPVVMQDDGALHVPWFGGDLSELRNLYATIDAGVTNLGSDAAPTVFKYRGTTHDFGPAPSMAGPAGSEGPAAGVVSGLGNGAAGAAQGAVRGFLGSQSGAASPVAAARLGGAAAGGIAGYATAPSDASQQERLERAGVGAAAGLALPYAFSGNVGRVVQAARIGSLAGGIPTLGHIALNTPVQIGLKLASDIPANIRYPEATAAELYGALQGIRSFGLNAAATLARPGPMAASMGGGVGPQLAETALTGAVRLHPVLQDLARQMASHMELWRQAAQAATDAGYARLGPQWRAEVQRLVSSPTSSISDAVKQAGDRAALSGNLGTTGAAVSKLVQDSPIARFLLPIFNIGYKVATQGIETSPLGGVGTAWDVARGLAGAGPYAGGNWAGRGANGAVTPLAERVRNNVIGVALAYEGYNQAAAGNITGEGPSDQKEQAALRDIGWQPDSIKIGGRYFNAHLLGPIGWSLIAGANAYEATHGVAGHGLKPVVTPQGERPPSDLDMLGDLAARQGRYFNNETFLNGLGTTLNAIGSSAQQGQMATREAASVFESLIPQGAVMGNWASTQDPFQRVPRGDTPQQTIQQTIATRLPWLRQDVAPRLSATGQPLPNPQAGAGLLLPRSSVINADPILMAMADSGVVPSAAPKSVAYGGAGDVQLTPAEQQNWERYRGMQLQRALGPLVTSADWQKMGDKQQQATLQTTLTNVDAAANRLVLRDITQGPGAGRSRISGGRGAPPQSYLPLGLQTLFDPRAQEATP